MAYAMAVRRLQRPGDAALARQIVSDMDERVSRGASWQVRDTLRACGFQELVEQHDRTDGPDHPASGGFSTQMEALLAMWRGAASTMWRARSARA